MIYSVELMDEHMSKQDPHNELDYTEYKQSYTRFPRSSCSRSRASNNDLKLPAPKPEKLCRWMISMKTVGRSMRCYACQYTKIKQDLNGYWIYAHLRKQLQQIPSLVKINQDIQIPDRLEILLQNQPGLLEPYL